MKLCTFEVVSPLGAVARVGVQSGSRIIDATAARIALLEQSLPAEAARRVGCAQVPADMIALIGCGQVALDWVEEGTRFVEQAACTHTSDGQATFYAETTVRLLAPVPRPAGMANFSVWPEHAALASAKGMPVVANRADSVVKPYWKGNPDSVVGGGVDLQFPPYAEELDVECELACIVGSGGKNLDLAAAERAIAGYTILNDVSARERQREEKKAGRGPSKGKDFDTGNAMGPWLVTRDEVGDVRSLQMSLHVNDQELSSASTASMIWTFAEMLSYLSQGQTIRPGQVISGGCYPRGSALDLGHKIHPGDLIALRITRLGTLTNRIAKLPSPA